MTTRRKYLNYWAIGLFHNTQFWTNIIGWEIKFHPKCHSLALTPFNHFNRGQRGIQNEYKIISATKNIGQIPFTPKCPKWHSNEDRSCSTQLQKSKTTIYLKSSLERIEDSIFCYETLALKIIFSGYLFTSFFNCSYRSKIGTEPKPHKSV